MADSKTEKIKVVVTGANGQVGSCLTSLISKLKNIELKAFNRQELDITNRKAVNYIINAFRPDFVINAAAYTAVDKAESDSEVAYSINEIGPSNLAKACQNIGAKLIHISTDYVFDGKKSSSYTYTEEDVPNPKSVYGKSKLAGELEVEKYCSNYIILRTSWVFGKYGKNFVKTMLKTGAERFELGVIGDQFGGPTYAGDISSSIVTIMNQIQATGYCPSGIYHFSGFPHVSWYKFAQTIFDFARTSNLLKYPPALREIASVEYPLPASRPSNSQLSNQKIYEIFSIKPSDWQQALENIEAYRT